MTFWQSLRAFLGTVLTADGFIVSAYGYAANQAGHGWVGVATFGALVWLTGPITAVWLTLAIWAAFEVYNRLRNGSALPWSAAASSVAYMGTGAVIGQALWLHDGALAAWALALFCAALAMGVRARE